MQDDRLVVDLLPDRRIRYVDAVVGISGDLMYFERLGNTSFASIDLAIRKARGRALSQPYRTVCGPARRRSGELPAVVRPLFAGRGGDLIVAGGKVIGAIAVSGSTAANDEQVSRAGASAIQSTVCKSGAVTQSARQRLATRSRRRRGFSCNVSSRKSRYS